MTEADGISKPNFQMMIIAKLGWAILQYMITNEM